jgi:hypothetical protein
LVQNNCPRTSPASEQASQDDSIPNLDTTESKCCGQSNVNWEWEKKQPDDWAHGKWNFDEHESVRHESDAP